MEIINLKFTNNSQNNFTTVYNKNYDNYNFFPTMLEIEIEENLINLSIDKIINFISEYEITFLIDEKEIFHIPINFFISMYSYSLINNYIKIPLNYELFYKNVFFNQNIEIKIYCDFINNDVKLNFNIEIKIKKDEKATINNEMYYQEIQKCHIINKNELTENIEIKNKNLTKGFFFIGVIDDILEIELLLNSEKRFCYNGIMINLLCTKINDQMLYVPFDINNNYDDCNFLTYISALNLSRIDLAVFNIKFKKLSNNLIIYTLSCNTYKNDNGNFIKLY
jgi:hypothetical protein